MVSTPDRSQEQPGTVSLEDVARWGVVAALVAAGIIHFAYAPVHLDDELSHGIFFLAAGWSQLALAGALALRARPQRVWLGLTALVNLAIIAVWVVARTAGVPGAEAEDVTLPDVTATTLEALVVLATVALASGRLAHRQLPGRAIAGLAGTGAVATVALVSVAVTPSFAGDHGVASHGHDGQADAAMGDADHGHAAEATAQEDWAEHRMAALHGYASPEQVEAFKQAEAAYLAEQIRSRSELMEGLPEAEREERIATYVDWAIENTLALLEGAQSNAEEMHTHGPVEWQPITDPAEQVALQEQLEASGQVIEQFPTVADAEAAGYRQISPYVPGIGAHWVNGDFDRTFDPGKPEMLLFNGTEPTSELIGLSYATIGPQPPEGFVGPNDVWHSHPGLCMLGGFVVGIDGTPEELCESVGGRIASGLADLHMAHLWQVPGWESEWGLFSAENPRINVATSEFVRNLSQT